MLAQFLVILLAYGHNNEHPCSVLAIYAVNFHLKNFMMMHDGMEPTLPTLADWGEFPPH